MQRAFSSEFPNDNSELHLGTIWMSEEPCGRPEAHRPPEPEPVLAQEEDEDETAEPIEIVDSIAIVEPDEVVPAPPTPTPPVVLDEPIAPVALVVPVEDGEPARSAARSTLEEPEPYVPPPAVSEVVLSSRRAEEIGEAIEIPQPPRVPVIAMELEAAVAPEAVAPLLPDRIDPFAAFLQTLSDAAAAIGPPIAARDLEARLESDAVACAWRAILRGESEDFALCTTTLDEWASATLATLLDAPSKAAQLRRELRARGVAAFGLVEAA